MRRLARYVITAGAVSLAASLGTATPTAAAPAARPVRCLRQPVDQTDIGWWSGGRGHTDNLTVATGSPCRDINVRGVRDVDGRPTCRKLRVRWASGQPGKWQRVCSRWTVIAYGAHEGDLFAIEAQGRPASVAVRS